MDRNVSCAELKALREAAGLDLAVLARRVAEADADLADLRATLVATEAALRRARDEARLLRTRLSHAATSPHDLLAETA